VQWTNLFHFGTNLLNQNAIHVKGKDCSFLVHYWGSQSGHLSNKPHQHSFFEVCYVLNGEGTYVDSGETFSLSSHTLFLSKPNRIHQIISDLGLDILFIGFELKKEESDSKSQLLFSNLQNTRRTLISRAEQLPIVNVWTALLMLVNEPQPLFDDSILPLCSAVFNGIERVFNDDLEEQHGKQKNGIASAIVYQAKLFIRDNLFQPLKLDDVADHLHISGRHLSRLFVSELGQSFSSYVRKEKVRAAGNLLTSTDLPIKEISEQTGFDTVHYFTNVFSAEMGMPPARFRKKFNQLHEL